MKFTLFCLLAILACALASDVGGKIIPAKGREKFTRLEYEKITVTLRGEEKTYKTFVYPNGLFKFTNIPQGTYILSIDDMNNFFDSVAVEVSQKGDKDVVRAYFYNIKTGKGRGVKHPITFHPSAPKQYYEVKEPFSIMSLFKNPMMIMMAVSLGLVFLMNKMPKPSKEEMEEMNKNMGSMPSFLTGGQ